MKYIDADKLIAKIKRLQHEQGFDTGEAESAYQIAIKDIFDIVNSLQQEQPDVDLEKALNDLDRAYFDLDGIAVKGATYYLTVNDLKDIARDFYELGQKRR